MGNAQARQDFGLRPTAGFPEEAQRRLLDGHFVARVLSSGDKIGDEALEYSLSPAGLEALQAQVGQHECALSSGVREKDAAKSVVHLLKRLHASFVSAPWFAACLERRLIVLAHAHDCMMLFPSTTGERDGTDSHGRPYVPIMQAPPRRGGPAPARSDLASRVGNARTLLLSGVGNEEPRTLLRMLRQELMATEPGAWYKRFAPAPRPRDILANNVLLASSALCSSSHQARTFAASHAVSSSGVEVWCSKQGEVESWWSCRFKSDMKPSAIHIAWCVHRAAQLVRPGCGVGRLAACRSPCVRLVGLIRVAGTIGWHRSPWWH